MTVARGLLLAAWLAYLVAAIPVPQPQIREGDSLDDSNADESFTPPSQNSLPPEDNQQQQQQSSSPRTVNNANIVQTISNRPFNPFDTASIKFDSTLGRLIGSNVNSSPGGTADSGLPRNFLAAPRTNNWALDFLDRLPQTETQELIDFSPKIGAGINLPPNAGFHVGSDIAQETLPTYPVSRDTYTAGMMNAKPLRAYSPVPVIGSQSVKKGSIFSGATGTNANTPQLQSLRSPINFNAQEEQQQQQLGEQMSETVLSIPPVNNYEAITTPKKDAWTRIAGRPFGFGDTATPPLARLGYGAGGRRPPPERVIQLSDLEEVLQGIMTEEDDDTSEKVSCEITQRNGYCDEGVNLPAARPVSLYDGTFEVRLPGKAQLAGTPPMQIFEQQQFDEQEVVMRPPAVAGGMGASRGLGYGSGPGGRLGQGPRMTTMRNVNS
ncbi:hypothetical protein ABW21_db0208218 [Orbilia brochopaga]|nr:hypothetical protein ABW21_db0208218 [Drechslerella brochopaga]